MFPAEYAHFFVLASLAICLLLGAVILGNLIVFTRHFRQCHPEIFGRVARRRFDRIFGRTLRNLDYLSEREYAGIDDPAFVRRCHLHRRIQSASLCLAIVPFLILLFALESLKPS